MMGRLSLGQKKNSLSKILVNQMGQEELIWAMRTAVTAESETTMRTELTRRSRITMETPREHQTKVMASLVPDEVIYNVNDYSHRHYEACFLFGDVSGFTDLCEKYTKTGVSGPSRMTQVLNKYLGSMVQEIMSHGGDVLKFSGDAFLAIFKPSEAETMRDVIHEALDCALVIQKSYGSYLTDVGIAIRVKLAISAGLVTFALIGGKTSSHYVVVGKPIWDVKAAESISSAGEIIVAPAAWNYINPNEYLFQEMSDNVHIKITGVGANWHSVQKNTQQKDECEDLASVDEESECSDALSQLTHDGSDDFSLRPTVNLAVRLNMKESLKRFIISPVMKSIENEEPFEYLTETRQVVIVFINVVSFSLETEETVFLADRTYKTVYSVVDKMQGCVNKVSLFDKDLMFVVVFGLRGHKHELECQVALRCAKQCHTAIGKFPGVLSTSIGVTTGKSYCGVFGHTLRREYTVISLIVNKAARLMVAYKNKVTCDKETFLHSKLEAKHFILQEYKPLKGISHPGPIYEFCEVEVDHYVVRGLNACPLLGRSENLKTYKQLLLQCREAAAEDKTQQFKMYLIKGEARQGKTRLLDELVYITPEDVSINKFSLTQKDLKIPYQTARLIFSFPLLLTSESSEKEKQEKLLNKLKTDTPPDLVCVLNDIFGVNFKKPDSYLTMTKEDRKDALMKMIQQLAHACFIPFWVLAIDNAEFIDDYSWHIVQSLFNIKTLFIVATIGRENLITSMASLNIANDPRVKVNFLSSIQRWYLGALVCQILDVYALPPELENAIQIKSNGNPGWIESFLITLMQDEGLHILKATVQEINDLGLVCPPLYMMARLTPEETIKWQCVMEERSGEEGDSYDHWQKYIDSCRNSFLNVTVREEMEALSADSKVPICVVTPNFNIAGEGTELSMDTMILKTFDSLNFFEQLLVKCSATLGEQFLREMLLYVMSANDKRKAALAVGKLFEIKVLTCAKGDFLGGTNVFSEKLLTPGEESKPYCSCKGLRIEVQCMDLPKYASCGFLQFRSTMFRDITYNLLTDNQKKEFHQRAIKFLERETRKCKVCGSGFFDRILGTAHDKEFVNVRDRRKKVTEEPLPTFETVNPETSLNPRASIQSVCQRFASIAGSSTTGDISVSSSVCTISRKSKLINKSEHSIPAQLYGEKSHQAFFGIGVVNKLKNSFSLTREFSSEDFTDCRCNLILSNTYAQLIDHCVGAGDLNKLIEAMLEYACICIILNNIPLAMTQLGEALEILKLKAVEKTENPWKLTLIRAKVYILLGYSLLEVGHLQEAHRHLNMALSEYGITFPTGVTRQMMILALEFKQLVGFYMFPRTLMKTLDHWETVYANNFSECMSHLFTVYMKTKRFKDAEMAACWSLTKSLESFSDFRLICVACANMLQIAHQNAKWNLCIALEVYALRICHLKKKALLPEDLLCIAKLYSIIFMSRVHRNDIDTGVHVGYIALRMATSVRVCKVILPLVPVLLHAFLIAKQYNNAHSVLLQLDFFAEEDTDNITTVWYYALCMVLLLETGYSVVSYSRCYNFYQMEGLAIRDSDARKRFYVVMWLWCLRNEKWETASIWSVNIGDFTLARVEDSISNEISALYLLEGMLLFLGSQMDKHNIVTISEIEHDLQKIFKYLEKAAQTTKLILPRLYHLKAYYKFIKKNDSKVTELLDKASSYAEKLGNALEYDWIEHTKKAWNKTLTPAEADFWKEHSEVDMLDFQDSEAFGATAFFTLPAPQYSCV